MFLMNESDLENIKKEIEDIKIDLRNKKLEILEIIDAFEKVFKNARINSENGIPSVDFYNPTEPLPKEYDPEKLLRDMVIDNIEYDLMEKVKLIRQKYKN